MLYRLEGRTPVEVIDPIEWATWMEASDRRVAYDEFEGIEVSTVFYGVNMNLWVGIPLVFETAVFTNQCIEHVGRYSTWEQAEAGHQKVVDLMRKKMVKAKAKSTKSLDSIIERKTEE